MPKEGNQKLKLCYLSKIMLEKTDEDHMITIAEVKKCLEEYGISAERKALYDDMEELSFFGLDIIGQKIGRNYYYYVGQKNFDIAEIKLLVDAIQASKFITERKSNELIKKLGGLVSEYEAAQLKREVVVSGRVKTMNESIYYSVDEIHRAILENKQIRFDYMKWNEEKKLESRGVRQVSPWALNWNDENYYLIAYDENAGKIKHYRVDKIKKIEIVDEKRKGKECFREFDPATYSKMNFGMFGGEVVEVKFLFKNELAGVFLDHFGKDIPMYPSKKKGWSQTMVEVAVSPQFFGWVAALGDGVKIEGPKKVVDRFTNTLDDILALYGRK